MLRQKDKRFPSKIFGGFIGFLALALVLIGATGCYFLQIKKRQRSDQNTLPETARSDGSRERQQNIYNEMPRQNYELRVLLPPNIPSNPSSTHGDVDYIPNGPPPAYSFDDLSVSLTD